MVRMLVGLVEPIGNVTFGTTAWTAIDWPKMRKKVAYLTQKPFFPTATTRIAMQFLLGDVDDETLRVALKEIDVWRRCV